MKGIKIFLILALGIFLSVPAYGDPPIIDPDPVNIDSVDAFYDYRDYGTWSRTFEGGDEGRSGAYFHLSLGVVIDGLLGSFNEVIEVKVKHLDTEQELFLMRGTCTTWIGDDVQYWHLFIKPENWMFDGIWKFTMTYKGSDNAMHRQTDKYKMRPVAFPMRPSHIQIVKDVSDFMLSWSGIGVPKSNGRIDYRVRIFEGGCVVAQIKGDWTGAGSPYVGTYDRVLNRVTFRIGSEWSRAQLRLENRVNTGPPISRQMSRACTFLQLPE